MKTLDIEGSKLICTARMAHLCSSMTFELGDSRRKWIALEMKSRSLTQPNEWTGRTRCKLSQMDMRS